MAAELTCARRTRKIAEENGDPHVATNFLSAKENQENSVQTPHLCKEDKKGLNETQTTIFSPIRLVVNEMCGLFVLHRYAQRFECN